MADKKLAKVRRGTLEINHEIPAGKGKTNCILMEQSRDHCFKKAIQIVW